MDKITLVISGQTLNTLALALGELPFKVAKAAWDEIYGQVLLHEQNLAKNQRQPDADRDDKSRRVGGSDSRVGFGIGDGEVGTA